MASLCQKNFATLLEVIALLRNIFRLLELPRRSLNSMAKPIGKLNPSILLKIAPALGRINAPKAGDPTTVKQQLEKTKNIEEKSPNRPQLGEGLPGVLVHPSRARLVGRTRAKTNLARFQPLADGVDGEQFAHAVVYSSERERRAREAARPSALPIAQSPATLSPPASGLALNVAALMVQLSPERFAALRIAWPERVPAPPGPTLVVSASHVVRNIVPVADSPTPLFLPVVLPLAARERELKCKEIALKERESKEQKEREAAQEKERMRAMVPRPRLQRDREETECQLIEGKSRQQQIERLAQEMKAKDAQLHAREQVEHEREEQERKERDTADKPEREQQTKMRSAQENEKRESDPIAQPLRSEDKKECGQAKLTQKVAFIDCVCNSEIRFQSLQKVQHEALRKPTALPGGSMLSGSGHFCEKEDDGGNQSQKNCKEAKEGKIQEATALHAVANVSSPSATPIIVLEAQTPASFPTGQLLLPRPAHAPVIDTLAHGCGEHCIQSRAGRLGTASPAPAPVVGPAVFARKLLPFTEPADSLTSCQSIPRDWLRKPMADYECQNCHMTPLWPITFQCGT